MKRLQPLLVIWDVIWCRQMSGVSRQCRDIPDNVGTFPTLSGIVGRLPTLSGVVGSLPTFVWRNVGSCRESPDNIGRCRESPDNVGSLPTVSGIVGTCPTYTRIFDMTQLSINKKLLSQIPRYCFENLVHLSPISKDPGKKTFCRMSLE
jgi:hypothetical protein